jgi:hypothetical protein
MKQSDLNRAVAHATGESVRLIEQLGFGLVVVPSASHHPGKAAGISARRRGRARHSRARAAGALPQAA